MLNENEIEQKIILKKPADYKRFYCSGAIVNGNVHGEFNIELYEDIDDVCREITYYKNGGQKVQPNYTLYKRTIHAGFTIPAHRLPELISALDQKYREYLDYIESKED